MTIRTMILAGLLFPATVMAERPAMSERDTEPALAEPRAIEQPPQAAPVPVEEPRQEAVVIQQITGDVIELQPGETIVINPLDFPRRGMSMEKVENEMGRPLEVSPTVGDPPITAWTYSDRVVFFEYSKVIHAVQRR